MMTYENAPFGKFDFDQLGIRVVLDYLQEEPDFIRLTFLTMLCSQAPPTDENKEFVRGIENEDERFKAYQAASLHAHESRHWYDMITSPVGLYLYSKSVTRLCRGMYLLNSIKANPKSRIIYPLRKHLDNRDEYLKSYPDYLDFNVFDAEVIKKSYLDLEEISEVMTSRTTLGQFEISTLQILEGLALASQESFIDLYFGEDDRIFFWKKILETGTNGEWYYGAIIYIQTTLNERIPQEITGLILFMSLCVNPKKIITGQYSPPEALRDLVELTNSLDLRKTHLEDLLCLYSSFLYHKQGTGFLGTHNDISNSVINITNTLLGQEIGSDEKLLINHLKRTVSNSKSNIISMAAQPVLSFSRSFTDATYNMTRPVVYFECLLGVEFPPELSEIIHVLDSFKFDKGYSEAIKKAIEEGVIDIRSHGSQSEEGESILSFVIKDDLSVDDQKNLILLYDKLRTFKLLTSGTAQFGPILGIMFKDYVEDTLDKTLTSYS